MIAGAFSTADDKNSSDDQELEDLGQSSAAPHGSLGVTPSALQGGNTPLGDINLSGVTLVDKNQAHQPDGLHGSSHKQKPTKTQNRDVDTSKTEKLYFTISEQEVNRFQPFNDLGQLEDKIMRHVNNHEVNKVLKKISFLNPRGGESPRQGFLWVTQNWVKKNLSRTDHQLLGAIFMVKREIFRITADGSECRRRLPALCCPYQPLLMDATNEATIRRTRLRQSHTGRSLMVANDGHHTRRRTFHAVSFGASAVGKTAHSTVQHLVHLVLLAFNISLLRDLCRLKSSWTTSS
jgi:hypothetical protein